MHLELLRRQRREAVRRAEEQARHATARALARERRLDELVDDEEAAWTRVAEMIATRQPTFSDALAGEFRAQTTADLVVLPTAAPGLTRPELASLDDIDGIATVTPVTTTHVYLGGTDRFTARAVPSAGDTLRPRVETGSLAYLTGDTVAVSSAVADAHGWRGGDRVPMRLDDGTEARPRLVAITEGPGGYDLLPAVLLPSDRVAGHTAPWAVTHALITLRPNANMPAMAGLTVLTREQWLDDTIGNNADVSRAVLIAVLAMTVAYTAVAVVNTLVMAVQERIPDLARFRLAGGTRRQALSMLLWEGGYVAAVGVGLGLAVTATSLTANTIAVRSVIGTAQPSAPWWVIILVAAGVTALVLLASHATGTVALRRRPLDGLSVPE